MKHQPLKGIRIVDFSWVLAGPMVTKSLALMGAEVIKIESATRPEYVRRDGHFPLVNNNKLSCTINITTPEGQDLVRRLVGISNVVIENFSLRVLGKYGIGYEQLRAVRPDLIFVSASGLGRTGPQADALAYGTLLQAYSGRSRMIGDFNSRLEGMGVTGWTDPVTSLWESLAVLAAIINLRRTGNGAYIDLSMMEATVALLPEALLRQSLGLPVAPNWGKWESDAAPSGCFRCTGDDAWLAVSVRSDAEWQGLCSAMANPELAADTRYAASADRIAARETLNALVAAWVADRDAEATAKLLRDKGVPAARSRRFTEVVDDPKLEARGLFPTMPDGSRGTRLPWRDGDGWEAPLAAAPELGADNDYVFRTLLGLSESEIRKLTESEAIR